MRRRGFTLIELLVVVAIIAVLISILLPGLQGAREQGKRATCLANLKGIGTGIQAYASEDRAEQPIPIHQRMMKAESEYWMWRTAGWFTWGGRDAQKEFLPGILLASKTVDTPNAYKNGVYGAGKRPLNRYIYGTVADSDFKKMEMYHCPSDPGYPNSPFIDDAPADIFEKPCYEVLGNSYRASKYGLYPLSGGGQCFALGPYGHRISTLLNAARLILIGEPSFFNMIGQDNGSSSPDPVIVMGWHKRLMTDNLLFTDGHAAGATAYGLYDFSQSSEGQQAAQQMNAVASYLSRGPAWTFDVYPTPGARIWGTFNPGNAKSKWPWSAAQDNLDGDP